MSSAIIIGAGPGVGRSVAQRFARERFDIGLVARRRNTVNAIAGDLHATGVRVHSAIADAGDEPALRAALDELVERLGVPDVVVYNAAVIQWDAIGELTADQQLEAWAVNVVGAITSADRLLPAMADRTTGTFIITGGMPAPVPQVISLSLGKAGVRALVELLDTQFGPSGVHIATVTVAGAVAPGTAFDADAIADEYWRLHAQAPGAREREITFDGRAQDHNTAHTTTTPVDVVQRLIDEVMNGGDLDLLDHLFTPSMAPKLRTAFAAFRNAFPDWHQETRQLVAEGHTVVARTRCTGTHRGPWQGLAPTNRRMNIDEVCFFRIEDHRISVLWGLEDTWTRMRQLAGDDARLGELGSLS